MFYSNNLYKLSSLFYFKYEQNFFFNSNTKFNTCPIGGEEEFVA